MKLIDWEPYLMVEIKCNDDYMVPPYFQNYETIFFREAKYEHCTFSFSVSKYVPPTTTTNNLNNNRSTINMSYNCKYNYNPKRKFGYWLPEPGAEFPRISVHQHVKLQKAKRKERTEVARKERTEVARKERIEVERNFVSPVGRDCFFAPSMAFRPVNKTMPSAPPATLQHEMPVNRRPENTGTVVTLAEERTANHDSRLFSFNFSIGNISFNTNCTVCPIL